MSNRILTNIDDTQTEIDLVAIVDFPESGIVQIESELIAYSFATDRKISKCIRGYAGTTAAAHLIADGEVDFIRAININPALVSCVELSSPASISILDVDNEVISIETVLADTLALTLPTPTDDSHARRLVVSHRADGAGTLSVNTISILAGTAKEFVWDLHDWIAA
jgi:hypothetical protein